MRALQRSFFVGARAVLKRNKQKGRWCLSKPVTDRVGGRRVTDGGRKVTDGGRKVTDGGRKVTDGGRRVTDGGRR